MLKYLQHPIISVAISTTLTHSGVEISVVVDTFVVVDISVVVVAPETSY